MKPFGRERVERVVRRARATLRDTAAGLLPRARESLQAERSLSRLFVRDGNRIVPIPLMCLERIQGADDYVTIYADGKEHLVSVRMSELEGQLPAVSFLRIHRSHLINLEHVTSIEPHDAGRVEVVMWSGARIVASRDGTKRLRDLAL
jgi:two-component system LytT family response regulator